MKQLLYVIFILLLPASLYGQISKNIKLLDNWQDNNLSVNSSNARYNECWGFVQNGIEYAIAGSTDGSHFFRITDDDKLELVDFVSGKASASSIIHRDYKVYQNYAYAVCDEGFSSLQIIDLSFLPDSVSVVVENDSIFSRVHNLYIDAENALMYACIITPFIGGFQPTKPMEVFSLADPLNPISVYSGPAGIPEVHDAYVHDNIAYLNCGFDGLRVYDFTNPAAPIFIQNKNLYQDQGYNHQGWLTPDGTKYIFGDETNGKRLKNCTVSSNQVTIVNRFGTNHTENSVPHNVMLSNDFAYVAYYNEGLRIYDIRPVLPVEVAHYDTYLDESSFKMEGAWGIYSQLPSGRLLVSDRHNGLFLLDFREDIFNVPTHANVDIYPNPVSSGDAITVRMNVKGISSFNIQFFNIAGQKAGNYSVMDQTFAEIPLNLKSGIYLVRISYIDYLGDEIVENRKILVN